MITNLTDEEFAMLGNFEELPIDYYIFQLGVGLQYEYAPPDISFYAFYPQLGKELWAAFKYEMHQIICVKSEPKEWLKDLISGDIRNAITGIVSAITAKYDVTLGIAIPVAALILKTGILKFCKTKPSTPNRKVSDILNDMKKQFIE